MKLTKRQLEMLKVYAGLIEEGPQSYYYGKHGVINRGLRAKGLIDNPSLKGWKPTVAGWTELEKRHRNFPANEAWKLVAARIIS